MSIVDSDPNRWLGGGAEIILAATRICYNTYWFVRVFIYKAVEWIIYPANDC
jgi:hypothetical protein